MKNESGFTLIELMTLIFCLCGSVVVIYVIVLLILALQKYIGG